MVRDHILPRLSNTTTHRWTGRETDGQTREMDRQMTDPRKDDTNVRLRTDRLLKMYQSTITYGRVCWVYQSFQLEDTAGILELPHNKQSSVMNKSATPPSTSSPATPPSTSRPATPHHTYPKIPLRTKELHISVQQNQGVCIERSFMKVYCSPGLLFSRSHWVSWSH